MKPSNYDFPSPINTTIFDSFTDFSAVYIWSRLTEVNEWTCKIVFLYKTAESCLSIIVTLNTDWSKY